MVNKQATPFRKLFYSHSRRTVWILMLCLSGAILTGSLFWVERQRQARRRPGPAEGSMEVQELAGANLAKVSASVYFRQTGSRGLVPSRREIFAARSPEVRARQLIQALIEGPQGGETGQMVPVLPREAKVRQIYMLKDGTAVVDFSDEVFHLLPGGIDSETTAMESIRRTLLENVNEIKTVRFLINGTDADTFAGHVAI